MRWDALVVDVETAEEDTAVAAAVVASRKAAAAARVAGAGDEHVEDQVSFRASCVRTAGTTGGGVRHAYKSVDVDLALGWSVGRTHPHWRVDLKRPTVNIQVVVRAGRY
jgi:adenylyl- and sulfurtransferase ThiI